MRTASPMNFENTRRCMQRKYTQSQRIGHDVRLPRALRIAPARIRHPVYTLFSTIRGAKEDILSRFTLLRASAYSRRTE